VSEARLDFLFAIGIADAARQGDDAVVREHLAAERIERGLFDVRLEDARFQIVEDDDAWRPAKPPRRALVELPRPSCSTTS